MKLLVVDDEYYIVKNIVDNINKEDAGFEQIYSAYSAAQAKRILAGPEHIDIMITDIEMPQESGLSLIQWAKEQGLLPVTMILTGHQRFDYAQAAINLHIFSYLLKPVDLSELIGQLQAAGEEVRKRKELSKQDRDPAELPLEEGREEPENANDTVVRIRKYIKEHLGDPKLNREQIADQVHMNEDYMSHIFSTRTGRGLSNYIQELRVEEAKRLLRNSDLTLNDICERTGFSSTSYFHRQFKKGTGMTPQQYREGNER